MCSKLCVLCRKADLVGVTGTDPETRTWVQMVYQGIGPKKHKCGNDEHERVKRKASQECVTKMPVGGNVSWHSHYGKRYGGSSEK